MNPLPHPLPLRTDGATLGLRRLVVPTSVGDVVVHAGREAGGPATILLHGAAGSWTTWTPLIAASDLGVGSPLADVVALDLPGWGESGGLDRVRTVEDMSDAVVEVARALGYSSWRVVGHSLGGFVALDLAARHPDATLGVILVSATGTGVLDAIRRPVRGGRALPWFAGMLLTMRVLAVHGGTAGRLTRALRAAGMAFIRLLGRVGWLGALSSPLFAGPVHPSVVAALAAEVRPAAFARAARLAADYEERTWTGIRCPVRSVRGARDVFNGESDAGAFVWLIPDFSEVRLGDAGHFANVERPDAVLAAIAATACARPIAGSGLAASDRRGVTTRPSRRSFGAAA